jgi:hypothetical protein
MANEKNRYNNWVASGRKSSPGMSAEDKALQEYLNAGKEFVDGGAAVFEAGTPLSLEQLATYDQLGPSAMGDITTDPKYREYELEALRQLEEQSQKGFTARDEADMARVEQQANRANRGRQGAIQQNMQSRGLAGSGLDFVMQQQAAQDSAEMEALAGLEKNAQMAERKQSAAERLGSLGSQLQGRDFNQSAAKAQAADEIARFNTANSVQRQQANNQIANQANTQNWNRNNTTSDRNTQSAYDFRQDKMGVQQQGASAQLEKANQDYNRAQLEKQAKARKRAGLGSALGGVAGAAIGTFAAPGVGTAAGYQMGSALGGNFAKGGRVPGPEVFPGDNEMNDIFAAQLSPGEVVVPKTIAQDPVASAQFVDAVNKGMDPMAAKYVAQNANMAAAEKVPFYPTSDGNPIPEQPKFERRTDGGMASRTKQTNRNAPIPEPVLAQLAQSNPSLVDQYRQRMGSQDKAVADAEGRKDMLDMANLVGKGLTDFANSQKDDVILKNNFLAGKNLRPEVVEAERKAYDGSMLDRLGAQEVQRAKEGRNRAEDSFFSEQKLAAADKANAQEAALKNPNSPESISARAFLKSLVPTTAKLQGFESMSAAQLEKASPMLMERWKADRAQANADREYKLKEKEIGLKGSEKKKLNGEEQKVVAYASANLKAIQEMRRALAQGDNTFSMVGDNNFTEAARRAAENFGRLQSGGAINKDEEARFMDMLPKATDSKEMQQQKLANIEAEMNARIKGLGESPEQQLALRGAKEYKQAPAGQKVKQNGITFVWDGSEYVPEE